MNKGTSPLVKILLVIVFFAVTMLLSGVRLHHDSPQSLSVAQQMAKGVSSCFSRDGRGWCRLAEKNPLLLLRLTSRY